MLSTVQYWFTFDYLSDFGMVVIKITLIHLVMKTNAVDKSLTKVTEEWRKIHLLKFNKVTCDLMSRIKPCQ